jgi:hypothetical protein
VGLDLLIDVVLGTVDVGTDHKLCGIGELTLVFLVILINIVKLDQRRLVHEQILLIMGLLHTLLLC